MSLNHIPFTLTLELAMGKVGLAQVRSHIDSSKKGVDLNKL